MKFCSSHYEDVRRAIQYKGMGNLVGDIATLRARAQRWLRGTVIPSDGFDPLMVTTLEIYKKASEVVGTHLNIPRDDGQHYCPLCEVDRTLGMNAADKWVDNCTDAILIICKANGLKLSR